MASGSADGQPGLTSSPLPSGLWSSFHSALAQAARVVPASPQRPPQPLSVPSSDPGPRAGAGREKQSLASEEFRTRFSELGLLMEYKLLCVNCPSGVYVLPSSKSLYEWHGVLFIHSGPYRESIFKFTLYIPDQFPQQRPMVRFCSKVYHPYIHSDNGIVNMTRLFPQWDPSQHHIWQVVKKMRDCFYQRLTWEGCDEAVFSSHAQSCALLSLSNLHSTSDDSDDGNLIRFPEVDQQTFLHAKQLLIRGDLPSPPPPSAGLLGHVRQFWDRLVSPR